MQDPSDSIEIAEPAENGQSNAANTVWDDPTPNSASESATASMVLAEVLPGVAVVFGEVPEELKLDLIDFGLVSPEDRTRISTVLASIGNTATAGGNLASAFASGQGLYKLSDATKAYMLRTGGTLAIKDGANLGTVISSNGLAQARFIPLSAVRAAGIAAAMGQALAMVALQMSLSEVTGLIETNIELTSQVLATIRQAQWTRLSGLVETLDDAVRKARDIESVPKSLWETVASKQADLKSERNGYRHNVSDHVKRLSQLDRDARRRREYLATNAEAIVFDAYALRSSLQAWTEFQMLHCAFARAAGREDAGEARMAESIARDTPGEVTSALAEITSLVDSLTRELRIIAELPGRRTVPLTGKGKDSKAARLTCGQLLEAIRPLADALHPPAPPLQAPDVVCAPKGMDPTPYLRILRWFLEDGETLRCVGFPYQLGRGDVALAVGQKVLDGSVGQKVLDGLDPEKLAMLVAVTDRRIIMAKAKSLRQEGAIGQNIPIDLVRYVRAVTTEDGRVSSAIDLITRDENIRWHFRAETDRTEVDAFAAVLAESMMIPDAEREELARRPYALAAGKMSEIDATASAELTGSETTTGDTE